VVKNIALVKKQNVVNHPFIILQETEKIERFFNRPTLKHVEILRNYKEKQFLLGGGHF
jgi:hypothetical protein